MTTRIQRSIAIPVRRSVGRLSWDERWHGPDRGLIICWEAGRELRDQDRALAARAEAGELVSLPWKGGTEPPTWNTTTAAKRAAKQEAKKAKKAGRKYGTVQYLAMWQGLRGEDLDIDLEADPEVTCSRRGVRVIFKRLAAEEPAFARAVPAAPPTKSETGAAALPLGPPDSAPSPRPGPVDPPPARTPFVAVDVETANADLASICQIGIVRFDPAGQVDEWQSLVNPEDFFDPVNVSIHGITEDDVRDAPTLPALYERVRESLAGNIVVCHTPFDRAAFRQAFGKYSLSDVECRWLDSARVARRAWPDVAQRGYGLGPLAGRLGIQFAQHVAKEDARAAGQILLAAVAHSGFSVDEWLVRATQCMEQAVPIAREGDPNGPLFGEVVVFTGALSMPRREAAAMAAAVGCTVTDSVTKETTILVVGDQDVRKLAGQDKSAKHRKAEELIAKGQRIRIVRETDFATVVSAV